MSYIIVKEVRSNKYYAKFPNYPVNFKHCSWQGLINNATILISKEDASCGEIEAQRNQIESVEVIRL